MVMKYRKVKRMGLTVPKTQEEKTWVVVEFEGGTQWMPSMVDVGRISALIGYCEDIKYPYGKGYLYFKDFLSKCFEKGKAKTKSEIVKIYEQEFNPNKLPFSK